MIELNLMIQNKHKRNWDWINSIATDYKDLQAKENYKIKGDYKNTE